MIPRTLSASSLQVAALCMDRWNAEYMNRAPGFSSGAADVGTSFHGGAEMFVKAVYIDKTHTGLTRPQQKDLLITFFQMSYVQTFGTADMETDEYKDAFALTMKWFERTNLEEKDMIGVESVEVKETIKVPYNHPDGTTQNLDFNYIMDRVDQLTETTWEVVDYKTIRVPLMPEDLENKVQARAYALAIQIKHPEATEVLVTFDQIRHERITLRFTREDNIAFWRYLCAETQRIVDTQEEDIRPTLNIDCAWCVKKATCGLMQKNIEHGGVHSLDVNESVILIDKIKSQMKAQKYLLEELEEKVYRHAAETDTLQWETPGGDYEVEIGAGRSRTFNFQQAAQIMGPELVAQMGKMNLGELDKIIKDESLDKDMRDKLASLISWTSGNLSLKVKPKKKLV